MERERENRKALCLKHLCLCASYPVQLVWLSSEKMLCSCFSGAIPVGKQQQSLTSTYIFLISRVHFVPALVIFNHEALGLFLLDIHVHMFRNTGPINHCSSFPIDVFLANQSPGTCHKAKSYLFKIDYFFAGTLFTLLQLSKTGFGWCKPISSLLWS